MLFRTEINEEGLSLLRRSKRGRCTSRLRSAALGAVVAVTIAMGTMPLTAPAARAEGTDEVIFDEGLGNGWENWSWDSSISFVHQVPYSGSRSIWWRIDRPWGGLSLHSSQGVQTSTTTAVRFALRASASNQLLSVALKGEDHRLLAAPRVLNYPNAQAWKVYTIPLADLGGAGRRITGIVIQDARGSPQPYIEVDDIRLTGLSPGNDSGVVGIPAYPEIRPNNRWANQTRGRPTNPYLVSNQDSFKPYYSRINGDYVGTTEQILEWAAKKWGFDQLGYPDLAKAQAVAESWWDQAAVGGHGEIGILQVKPSVWPDADPARWSTAYAADYAMAVIRMHYDGNSWLGDGTRGSVRNAVAAWECGCGYSGWNWYANRVFAYYDSKPWRRPGQPPEWF